MDDGLKLIKKELIIPKKSNPNVFLPVPILFFDFSLILFSILPLQDFGLNVDFTLIILFQLFLSNFNLQCNIIAAVTSNSKYSVYGCLRIAAQILSQEIIIGSSSLIILLAANTLSQSELIEYQFDLLLILPLFSLYLSQLLTIVSETTRAPFDLLEAESELVGGQNTEYPGLQFSLFFIAEYCNVICLCSVASIYFLGILVAQEVRFGMSNLFFTKVPILIQPFAFVNLRSTFPRYRQDQLIFQS